jgi:DUF438 domain-containing protein
MPWWSYIWNWRSDKIGAIELVFGIVALVCVLQRDRITRLFAFLSRKYKDKQSKNKTDGINCVSTTTSDSGKQQITGSESLNNDCAYYGIDNKDCNKVNEQPLVHDSKSSTVNRIEHGFPARHVSKRALSAALKVLPSDIEW